MFNKIVDFFFGAPVKKEIDRVNYTRISEAPDVAREMVFSSLRQIPEAKTERGYAGSKTMYGSQYVGNVGSLEALRGSPFTATRLTPARKNKPTEIEK